ncbi:MAG: hypothetical protein ACRDJH_09410 [Thermomicrobiales bacterium]
MSTKSTAIAMAPETVEATDRTLGLLQEFVAETIADEAFQLPPGVSVVLAPDDDAAFGEATIANGLAAIREGKDVYLHHLRRGQ